MRIFRKLSITRRAVVGAAAMAVVSMLTVFLLPQVTVRDARPEVRYTALGDSYSAGTGTDLPLEDNLGPCLNSALAYPDLWSRRHQPAAFTDLACGGATTSDVAAQVDQMEVDTTLVTLSAGGNDVGFTEVVIACTTGLACSDQAALASDQIVNRLGPALDDLYAKIRARAPGATVIVTGYPELFEAGECPGGMPIQARETINGLADELSAVTAEAVHRAGNGFVFADPQAAFIGHRVCSKDPWLNSLTVPYTGSYHPNAAGQQLGYLPVVESAIG